MSRYFLFGTLMWGDLLRDVAGADVVVAPASLRDWSVERAAAGDWPVLVPGGMAQGCLTDPLTTVQRARLDWYEVTFGYVPQAVTVDGPEGPVSALVYREAKGAGGAGEPWRLADWIAANGARTRLAAQEVLRGLGRVTPEEIVGRRNVVQARAQGSVAARAYLRPATVGCATPADAVQVDAVKYPYEGFHRVEEWSLDHPRFDGTRSGTINRTISHVTDAATILPYDPARDRVLLVEQIRIGALAKGDPRPWMLEPVAGLIDAGETPQSTALREVQEEAGLNVAPQDLHFVARYYPSPGGIAQILHSFVGVCDLRDGAGGLHGLAAEGEDIRTHLVPLEKLLSMIESGEAANAPLILSAQWLALHRDRLRG